jgi:hypothetical protein
MIHRLSDAALCAAPLPAASGAMARSRALLAAARSLLPALEAGRTIDAAQLRGAMSNAFGGTGAQGAWDWKSAYDACEAAEILFLLRYGPAIVGRLPSSALALIERIAALMPTHTRCSETSQALQQFSTPPGLAFVAAVAASIGRAIMSWSRQPEPECSASMPCWQGRGSRSTSWPKLAPDC